MELLSSWAGLCSVSHMYTYSAFPTHNPGHKFWDSYMYFSNNKATIRHGECSEIDVLSSVPLETFRIIIKQLYLRDFATHVSIFQQ